MSDSLKIYSSVWNRIILLLMAVRGLIMKIQTHACKVRGRRCWLMDMYMRNLSYAQSRKNQIISFSILIIVENNNPSHWITGFHIDVTLVERYRALIVLARQQIFQMRMQHMVPYIILYTSCLTYGKKKIKRKVRDTKGWEFKLPSCFQ